MNQIRKFFEFVTLSVLDSHIVLIQGFDLVIFRVNEELSLLHSVIQIIGFFIVLIFNGSLL